MKVVAGRLDSCSMDLGLGAIDSSLTRATF